MLPSATTAEEAAFLESVQIALDAVVVYAARLASRCEQEAAQQGSGERADELRQMAANLRLSPAGPA